MSRIQCFGLMILILSIAWVGSLRASCQGTMVSFSSLDPEQRYALSATLYLPGSVAAPVPAIVMVHGTAGVNQTGEFYRQPLLDAGIAIFEVNFKTGVFTGTMDRPRIATFVPMAFAALRELRKKPAGLVYDPGFRQASSTGG